MPPFNDETQDTECENDSSTNDNDSSHVCHLMLNDARLKFRFHIFFSFCERFTLDLIYIISISFSLINRCGNKHKVIESEDGEQKYTQKFSDRTSSILMCIRLM